MSGENNSKPYENNDFYSVALDAFCRECSPAVDDEPSEIISMYSIREMLDSLYGMNDAFDGQEVYNELIKRGYKSVYDPGAGMFMFRVKVNL